MGPRPPTRSSPFPPERGHRGRHVWLTKLSDAKCPPLYRSPKWRIFGLVRFAASDHSEITARAARLELTPPQSGNFGALGRVGPRSRAVAYAHAPWLGITLGSKAACRSLTAQDAKATWEKQAIPSITIGCRSL